LGSFQFFRDKIRDDWFELSINYRHGPLSAEKWPLFAGGIAAGDRLPDAPLTSESGTPTTLFAAIRGTRHALLLLPGSGNGEVIARLLAIAAEVGNAFPYTLSPHVITKAGTASDQPKAVVPVWLDTQGRVYQKLHATECALVLVRPDGYIGYRSQPADAKSLLEYLDRYLVRKN
jgi:hypothetical protein